MMLSDVCLSVVYIGPKSRTERPRKTKIGTIIPRHMWLKTPLSRSKGQGHRAALLTTVLARQAAAAVGVGVLAVGSCCYVAVCSAAQGALAPSGEEKGGGISWRSPAYSLFGWFGVYVGFRISISCNVITLVVLLYKHHMHLWTVSHKLYAFQQHLIWKFIFNTSDLQKIHQQSTQMQVNCNKNKI